MFSRLQQGIILDDIKLENLELALYMTDPTASDTGTEADFGAYARKPIAFGANQVVADGTLCSNSALILFPQATSDCTAPVTHFAVRIVGGGMVARGTLQELGIASSRMIRAGDVFRVQPNVCSLKVKD